MNEKLIEIKTKTAVLLDKVKSYRQELKGDMYNIYGEIVLMINDMLIDLKRYDDMNYSCKLILDNIYQRLYVLFRIFDYSHLKVDSFNLMGDINELILESEVK